jgi:hypothetical protein
MTGLYWRAMEALIVVDVQNDFCPGGALAVPAGDEIIDAVNRLATQGAAGHRHARLAPARPRLVRRPRWGLAGSLRAGHARRTAPSRSSRASFDAIVDKGQAHGA